MLVVDSSQFHPVSFLFIRQFAAWIDFKEEERRHQEPTNGGERQKDAESQLEGCGWAMQNQKKQWKPLDREKMGRMEVC